MEDLQETLGRINAAIQRIRQKTNGADTSLQNQESQQQQMDKDLFKACPMCGGKGFIIKYNAKQQDTVTFCNCKQVDKTKILWRLLVRRITLGLGAEIKPTYPKR